MKVAHIETEAVPRKPGRPKTKVETSDRCRRCQKPIALALAEEALCCECCYESTLEREPEQED